MPGVQQRCTQAAPVSHGTIDVQAVKPERMFTITKTPPDRARDNATGVVLGKPGSVCAIAARCYVSRIAFRIHPADRIAKNKGQDTGMVAFDGRANKHLA